MIDEMKRLVKDFKPCGQITVQLIHDDISQKITILKSIRASAAELP